MCMYMYIYICIMCSSLCVMFVVYMTYMYLSLTFGHKMTQEISPHQEHGIFVGCPGWFKWTLILIDSCYDAFQWL